MVSPAFSLFFDGLIIDSTWLKYLPHNHNGKNAKKGYESNCGLVRDKIVHDLVS